jgi:hypothetical protein
MLTLTGLYIVRAEGGYMQPDSHTFCPQAVVIYRYMAYIVSVSVFSCTQRMTELRASPSMSCMTSEKEACFKYGD